PCARRIPPRSSRAPAACPPPWGSAPRPPGARNSALSVRGAAAPSPSSALPNPHLPTRRQYTGFQKKRKGVCKKISPGAEASGESSNIRFSGASFRRGVVALGGKAREQRVPMLLSAHLAGDV